MNHVDVEPKIGGKITPQNGWVYFMENPTYEQMDDLGGKNPLFLVQHLCVAWFLDLYICSTLDCVDFQVNRRVVSLLHGYGIHL